MLKFKNFRKTQPTDYTACRQETLQEAAVFQIPIGFLQIFFTFYPPDMPAIPPTLTSHPDRRPPRLKDSPGLGGALTPSNNHIIREKWKSVLAQNHQKKSKSAFKPLRQKSYRAEIKLIGGHFSRRICVWRSKNHSSSKTARSWFDTRIFWKKCKKKMFGGEKWNVGDRLKRVFPKLGADRSHVRGVNGRSKFKKSKGNVRYKNWSFGAVLVLRYRL